MKESLKNINEIISVCERMISYIEVNGIIKPRNSLYNDYKEKIYSFLELQGLTKKESTTVYVLDKFCWSGNDYTVNLKEAQMILKTVVGLKHELFPNDFEKIFISHREKDKEQIAAFIELLYTIGIPRPKQNEESVIFCTSHPASYIDNGNPISGEIKNFINSHYHAFYILWYTDRYFESQPCLQESGAIWSMGKKYQEILQPGFDRNKITGLLSKDNLNFYSNDSNRLNILKGQIEKMFSLEPVDFNYWESSRNEFISKIDNIVKKQKND